jgi:outer membrane immunogenic protein
MMTKTIRTGIAIAALLVATVAAQAADLPQPTYKAPPYSAPSYMNWTGFYVGLNGGYGFGKSSWSTAGGGTGDFDVKGPLAGVTLGYNFQTGVWVWGIEGDLDYSWIKGSTTVACGDCETRNTWLGTARGRVGYAGWNNWLPYITGGAAFGGIKGTETAPAFSATKTAIGWTAGAGIEYALWTNWSIKGEYLYADLGKVTCTACGGGADVDVKFKTNLVRLGVNYRF